MRLIAFMVVALVTLTPLLAFAETVLFADSFEGKLDTGWSWVRENKEAWRVTEKGLQIRIEPGNMWGGKNDAKNVLVRALPPIPEDGIAVTVTVANKPTSQYEQVDLVWYYNDSNMVKIGLEQVDEVLEMVMGREEDDKTNTVLKLPVDSTTLQVRFVVRGTTIRGEYRPGATGEWLVAGECELPVDGEPKVSLQAYQGPADAEHWATYTDFCISTAPKPK